MKLAADASAGGGVVQKPFLGNTDERSRPADDGGDFTRKDVKSMRLELFADLLLQRDSRVVHHTQQADELQLGVQVRVHLLDRVDEVAQRLSLSALQREVFALHRDDEAMALHMPFSVSRLNDGGQSISTKLSLRQVRCVQGFDDRVDVVNGM
jgi:hypothetical protein